MSNISFPLHGQNPSGLNSVAPPEVPLMLDQSKKRLSALAIWKKGLIDGVDLAIKNVNHALTMLPPNSPEMGKLAQYMQRCIDHKMRILHVMDLLASEEVLYQKFFGYWMEGKEIPGMLPGQLTPQAHPVGYVGAPPQAQAPQIDPRLPIGPDGKPVGVVRADGIVDVTAKSTSIPVNGQLTPEQAAELGVLGPPGPAGVVPVPVNAGGQLTKEQLAVYTKAEEEKAKSPAKNVAGNPNGQVGQ